ncbi:hypothetical protein GJAV_G00054010 [Gymnothorax javanicus]|nr:hypothetical protein GJAV_G00054010 [Gymnothorax javanicus]
MLEVKKVLFLKSGCGTMLSWLEKIIEQVNCKFEELDEATRSLTERLEHHKQELALQAQQDQVWVSLLDEKFTTMETNLFFSYVADTFQSCRYHVVRKLLDLAPNLPSMACILRRKVKNRRINVAWESTLRDLGLENSDVKVMSAFFVTHGYQAEYISLTKRQRLAEDMNTLISKAVENPVLKYSLLKAVQVVEKGKAGALELTTEEDHKPASSIREHFSNQVTQ